MVRLLLALVIAASLLPPTMAAELKILPGEITLRGSGAAQRLLVVEVDGERVLADVTSQAQFQSAAPALVAVDEAGLAIARGDGAVLVTATHGGRQAAATVRVTQAADQIAPSFRNDVIPILTRAGCNSGACHGALAGKGGLKLSLRGYDSEADHFALTRQALGRRIDGQEPDQSLMLLKPTGQVKHGGGRKLDPGSPDHELLRRWIVGGAPGLITGETVVARVEALPRAATLKPGDGLQVLVRAWHGDGRAVDVTRWARFSSTDDLVASVDDNGHVVVKGHGEATVNVLFGNGVATMLVTSPFPNEAPASASPAPPGSIDAFVDRKLRELRIPASPPCSDHAYIRRAFLDAAGILPTPEEAAAFTRDERPDKRARLIDALLERPEFVDYWTYKWCDLLLVSSRKLPQPAVWAYYQFVRQSVADNKPWDRFAREILTASGSTLQNGAANYFVLHKDVSELTEATSQTFLGTSITCCRCHNHPLEKWTQDQYWSFANLFSRVGIKNGERNGEVFVHSQSLGEAQHPRRGVAMPPTPLDGQPLPPDDPGDRRKHLAAWVTSPDNPYFARAIVNRVWRNFMGRGLIEAEDDVRATNPPTNPELLDALVRDFVAPPPDVPGRPGAYDLKGLMRRIMNSSAYQRSSQPLPGNVADDRYYSRYLVRRLAAEVVLDAYSQVTGVPTAFNVINVGSSGGTAETNHYPLGTRALQLPDTLVVSQFLDAFGRPERGQTCACERQQDASVGQALHLNNGQTLNDKLRGKNPRIEQWLKENVSDETAIERVFLLALSRGPTPGEMAKFRALLAEAAGQGAPRREAVEDLFWAVLTVREFLFNH